METNSLKNLIEILKSQVALFTELRDLLSYEKKSVTGWKNNELTELNKKKEQLSKKEALLEEARKTISLRINKEYGLPEDATIQDIIENCPQEEAKDELTSLRDELLTLVADISQITAMLKVIYSTNLRIISDIKSKMGFVATNKYGMEKSTITLPTSIAITG